MPRLGDFEFPDATLEEALAAARTLAKELGRQDADKAELATILGKGDVRITPGQLENFGLLDVKDKRFRVSKLAHLLARRTSANLYIMSLLELCRAIPMFRLFLENALQHGVARTKSDLSVLVTRLTSAKSEDIEARIDGLWDQYQGFLKEVCTVLATPGRKVGVELHRDTLNKARARENR